MKINKTFLSIVVASSLTTTLFSDIVHADDVIVQFSLAVGNDAVNGESFGFDTMRLKENNLRINFDDTSNSASFPRNDWRIVINDTSNGGDSYFGIEDSTAGRIPFRVEAGAPVNALYVENSGDIGIGTNNPVVELHVADGDSPTLRLEQNGTSGFTPQTWDVAGNETNFFVRDVTHSSALPFRIKAGSGNDDALVIAGDGKIGMGTDNPSEQLEIRKAGPARLALVNTSITEDASQKQKWILNSNGTFRITAAGSGVSEFLLDALGNLTIAGTITASGTAFPDYVFEEGYDLRSLNEVDQFIQENGHLPGIPNANDVASHGGHNMTQLQLTLLEKVEELTLYTIEQNRINHAQNQVIQTQESRIQDLEGKVNVLMSLLE